VLQINHNRPNNRRWVRAEWDGVWGGVSPLQPTKGSGERHELPQRGPRQSHGRKRILAYFEGHRTLICVPIWQNLGGGAICISVPPLQILGDLSPRDLCPWLLGYDGVLGNVLLVLESPVIFCEQERGTLNPGCNKLKGRQTDCEKASMVFRVRIIILNPC